VIQTAGVGLDDPLLQDKLEIFLDLAKTPEGGEILGDLAAAPDEERRRLVELIADKGLREDIATLKQTIRERLAGAEGQRVAVTVALKRELGGVVAAAGGQIEADGALVFPDTVLFQIGSAEITPHLRAFLERVCLPWFHTLETSGAAISDLRIEGHADPLSTGAEGRGRVGRGSSRQKDA
jgi:hypothetical protein